MSLSRRTSLLFDCPFLPGARASLDGSYAYWPKVFPHLPDHYCANVLFGQVAEGDAYLAEVFGQQRTHHLHFHAAAFAVVVCLDCVDG
ncbi:hypothetical protein WK03_00580 [Burkholderia cepacia]|nr:hypothetical protein WK03_00580 [Burkholderia cepacia]